ncbi:MAG: tRNA 2-selenouridine(34) synthase MnmH [Alphaproteobacteria bacterium]|nr:tRNA 2-selenouridine(34) synthase MnmH [Alphaproteobacteria bacterium]MBU1527293.1 tRNA 2-selenouridine(34) synthase MnmH [Alphaproteobacteria bacterium]MBU2116334.1 tRNA 2-selenouridine(34) synthase MnmH [Alphaproteobacteria bacterium]MBU2349964.1 tRNA 2-selenouridine(34) synthase MnmH [Alphaproteobacteria bacterium]MBU2382213.1 tRNA 2-selenouridine(34) synthase MnmH [Alphaproteobacteria bacterium]
MIRATTDVSIPALAAHDAIIDVRSPAEFAEDHLPGAINLPVLDDAQRAEVGTEYVQGSKFLARRHGAALVARNIAAHLEGALADRGGGFRPLVHCWRGGQRSHAMATVMDQVGWHVTLLEGGYRTWRRAVVDRLHDGELGLNLVLLDGPTGCGKTALLGELAAGGVQTLDLEGLANHRGSLFGALPGGQPPQKLFESRLFAAVAALDPARPVVVEAESSKIGRIVLPRALWSAMGAAPVIEVSAPVAARADFTCATYADIAADPGALDAALTRLPRHLSKALIAEWRDMAAAGRVRDLAEALIREHYDPAYARSRTARERRALAAVELAALDPPSLSAAAARLEVSIEAQTAA